MCYLRAVYDMYYQSSQRLRLGGCLSVRAFTEAIHRYLAAHTGNDKPKAFTVGQTPASSGFSIPPPRPPAPKATRFCTSSVWRMAVTKLRRMVVDVVLAVEGLVISN